MSLPPPRGYDFITSLASGVLKGVQGWSRLLHFLFLLGQAIMNVLVCNYEYTSWLKGKWMLPSLWYGGFSISQFPVARPSHCTYFPWNRFAVIKSNQSICRCVLTNQSDYLLILSNSWRVVYFSTEDSDKVWHPFINSTKSATVNNAFKFCSRNDIHGSSFGNRS